MNTSRFTLAASVLALAVLAGCASPANPQNMSVRAAEATDLRSRTPAWSQSALAVKDVTGGRETNPAWTSQVSSNDFRTALEDSLRAVGMWSAQPQAKYLVQAHLAKLDQPFGGFNMTVTATVDYELIDKASGKTVLKRTLTLPYTAAMGDAFSGVERLRLANEGAIRTSVTEFVKLLQAQRADDIAVR